MFDQHLQEWRPCMNCVCGVLPPFLQERGILIDWLWNWTPSLVALFFLRHSQNISLWHRGAPQVGGPQFRWTPSETGNLDNRHFFTAKQTNRTAEPQAVVQMTKWVSDLLYTYQPRNCLRKISPVHASNYLQKACTWTNGCIVCNEKWRNVSCCIARNSRNWIGEVLISIIWRGRKLNKISGSWICRCKHGIINRRVNIKMEMAIGHRQQARTHCKIATC